MKRYHLIILLLICACSKPLKNDEPERKGLTERGKQANLDEASSYSLISVEIGATREQVSVTEDHLYGKFFDERAEFYIVENPELYISDTEVNKLTLYFIDGTLCKKKYELAEDISGELIKAYGGFKFKALNDTTYKLSRAEKIVLKTEEGNQMNEKFNRYQMRWDDYDVLIKYVVFKDTVAGQLELVEELAAYKTLLRAAELEI